MTIKNKKSDKKVAVSNPVKTVVVKFANLDKYQREIDIDTTMCDDFYLEACTRAVEQNIRDKKTMITPFIEVKVKNNKYFRIYNAYKVLINASYHIYANTLRIDFKKTYDIDLNDEPVCSKSADTKKKSSDKDKVERPRQ